MRDARIAPRATGVLAEEQGAVFPVVAGIVIVSVVPCQRIEGIELCAHRWDDAAGPIGLAGCLRGCNHGLEMNDRKGLVIFASGVRRTQGADAAAFDRLDCNRSGAVAPAVRPVEQVGGAGKLEVSSQVEV